MKHFESGITASFTPPAVKQDAGPAFTGYPTRSRSEVVTAARRKPLAGAAARLLVDEQLVLDRKSLMAAAHVSSRTLRRWEIGGILVPLKHCRKRLYLVSDVILALNSLR